MIQALGFLDVSQFTARFLLQHQKSALTTDYGLILPLRDSEGDDDKIVALPVLKDWQSARALLSRLANEAAPFLDGQKATLKRAAIEVLNPECVTPWAAEEDDYAKSVARTRICLVPSPGALTHSGGIAANLGVGIVNIVDHRVPHCETNFGERACARVHLIVDVLRIDAPE